MSPIPDDELISAYLDDDLSREDRLRAEQLLLDRADLRRLFDELRGLRQGLRSLPKFSLGDEFSSAVLRQAERSVLQGDEADKAQTPAAETTKGPIAPTTPPAVVPQASQQQQARAAAAPVVLADRSRALRPIVYALATVAAALAIMFYQQGVFEQRDVAMKAPLGEKANKSGSPHEAATAAKTHADDTRNSSGSAMRAKNGLTSDGGAPHSSVAAVDRNIAPGADMAVSPKAANSRGAVPTDAPGGPLFRLDNNFAMDKAASTTPGAAAAPTGPAAASSALPITVPMPTVALGAAQQVDALASNGTAPGSVETVALEDYKRLQSLVFNSSKAQRSDGTVDAVRLQELASVDAQQQLKPQDGGPASAAPADAILRKQTYGYGNGSGNELQLQNQNSWSYGNGNGLLVVNIAADRETIEKKFPKLLEEQRVDDFSKVAESLAFNSLGIAGNKLQKEGRADGGSMQSGSETERLRELQRELASRGPAANAGDGRPGEPDAKRAAGPTGRAGVAGQAGAIAGKAEGIRRELAERDSEKGDSAKADAEKMPAEAEVELEYVRIVANEDQMKAILKTVRAEKQLFVDISVEGTPEVYATNRWREFGLASKTTDAKSQAPAGVVASPNAMAAAAAGSTAGGSGRSIAPAPVAATKPTATPAPTNLAATPTTVTPGVSAPLAAAPKAAMPKAAPAANAYAGTAPAPAAPAPAAPAPATPPPGAAPSAPPPAAPLPGASAAQAPASPPTTDQPIARSAAPQSTELRVESQGYADQQRRGYSQSRWQRSNVQQVYEQLFNERQLEAGRSNNFAVANSTAEKAQGAAGVAEKSKDAGKLNEIAKKAGDAPAAGGNGAKVADPAGAPLVTREAELKQMQLGAAGAPPAPKSDAPANSTPSKNGQSNAIAANDAADARLRDAQAGNQAGGGRANNVVGGGFTPAPPMLPTQQQQIAPAQQAAPEEVLGRIAGVQQAPPLVQQAMPSLAPNRIRGVTQDEQAPSQDFYRSAGELPPDYQEALFVFRVVKSKAADKPTADKPQSESDAKSESKPAKQ
jgi:hypothetical protein